MDREDSPLGRTDRDAAACRNLQGVVPKPKWMHQCFDSANNVLERNGSAGAELILRTSPDPRDHR